jgi:hypothetical protein
MGQAIGGLQEMAGSVFSVACAQQRQSKTDPIDGLCRRRGDALPQKRHGPFRLAEIDGDEPQPMKRVQIGRFGAQNPLVDLMGLRQPSRLVKRGGGFEIRCWGRRRHGAESISLNCSTACRI